MRSKKPEVRSKKSKRFANAIGAGVDAVFTFITFRGLIRDIDDLHSLLIRALILLVPYTIIVAVECYTGTNWFSMLGVSSTPWVREGRVRCTGSFRYASLLGTFGAALAPMYFGILMSQRDRWAGFLGVALSLSLVWLSNSGGPVMALGAAVVGWCLWGFRANMRLIRRAIVAVLVVLSLVMNSPTWYIFDRISGLIGGDGWHRSYLFDVALKHLDSWWLAGVAMIDTSDWFPYTLESTGGADITNQYILFGVNSGLVAIILFVMLLVRSYVALGNALTEARTFFLGANGADYYLWGLGVALTVHVVNWFGVPYFDQIYVIWFMQLAAIVSVTTKICEKPEENADGDQVKSLAAVDLSRI